MVTPARRLAPSGMDTLASTVRELFDAGQRPVRCRAHPDAIATLLREIGASPWWSGPTPRRLAIMHVPVEADASVRRGVVELVLA